MILNKNIVCKNIIDDQMQTKSRTAVWPKPDRLLEVSDALDEKILPTRPEEGELNKLDWLKGVVCPKGEVFCPKAEPVCEIGGAAELNNGDDCVLPKILEPNGEEVWAGAVLNRDGDCPKLGAEEELAPNGDGDEPKIEGAAAEVEEPKADELKAGAAEVPNPEEKGELFGANGLELGVVEEKGLADDWPNTGEGEKAFVCVVDVLKPAKPVDWPEGSGPPKLHNALSQNHHLQWKTEEL